jgi:alpha/beta superfamily hydrolase
MISSSSHASAPTAGRIEAQWIGGDPSGDASAGRPSYLGVEPSGTPTFLHEVPGIATRLDTAVLLCPPFGWEEVCSYRALRGVAMLLAQAGYPTARLTLPGTGDGAGGPRDGDLVRRWIDAVGAAATWLRDGTNASRCLAFGIGLGGVLAYLAARDHDAIDDLALWAVPDRGRTLLHESRSLAKVIAADFPEDRGRNPEAAGDLELIGYLMTAETQAALSALELSALPLPRCSRRRVLLLSRGSVSVDRRLQESLERQGAEVTAVRATDYYGLMVKPEHSEVPASTVAHVLGWLERGSTLAAESTSTLPRTPTRVPDKPKLELAGGVIERPIRAPGTHGDVFGILSRGPSAGPAPLAVLLLSSGALPRTGPNRVWVEMARRWATRGIPTVRLDLAGIGDAGGEDPKLVSDEGQYQSWRIDDVRRVLDHLEASAIADRFVLGGLCSGANCALQGALADSRVCGLLLINLFLITWSAKLIAARNRGVAIGDHDCESPVDNLDRAAERRQAAHAIAAFDQLRERGTETLLLFGEREALLQEFRRQGLLDQLHRWPNLRLERIPSRDQMFRAQWLQRHVHERVDEALESMLGRFGVSAIGTA